MSTHVAPLDALCDLLGRPLPPAMVRECEKLWIGLKHACIWGFLKCRIPKTMGFNTKIVKFWMIWGTPTLGTLHQSSGKKKDVDGIINPMADDWSRQFQLKDPVQNQAFVPVGVTLIGKGIDDRVAHVIKAVGVKRP